MTAMIDARCPKCGKRFGWCGTMSNMPACPRCGRWPQQAELDADEAKMKALEEQLLTHPRDASLDMLRRQRVGAGLTLSQAAKKLGVEAHQLADVEWGRAPMPDGLAEKMAEVYGVGEG